MIERDVSTALGRDVSWAKIVELAKNGNETVHRVIDAAGTSLGVLVGLIANIAAPEVVIIGGEGVELAEVAGNCLQEEVARVRDTRAMSVNIVFTSDENNSWFRGAATIAIQRSVLAEPKSEDS